ncbi:MAG: type II toxin-antitoxin system RelE/ParE family toxin [Hyphomicrobiaceae bacterium]
MANEVRQTSEFQNWLKGLRDRRAVERIAQRTVRLEYGLFGDVKFFDGIGELRIDYGPGYRVYFCRRGAVVIILLCGGDKASQQRDIKKAIAMAKEV